MNLTYQILYWRDIPSQVKVRSGRDRVNRSLSTRFQEAIDEAAMRARATSSDDYLEDWRSSEWKEGQGDPEQFADSLILDMESAYSPDRLETLKANAGKEP